jgi:hypothetical protein
MSLRRLVILSGDDSLGELAKQESVDVRTADETRWHEP